MDYSEVHRRDDRGRVFLNSPCLSLRFSSCGPLGCRGSRVDCPAPLLGRLYIFLSPSVEMPDLPRN